MKLFSTVVGVTATALVVAAAPAHAADLPVLAPQSFGDFSVQTRYFDVTVGPDRDQHCTVVGDIYVPTALGPNNRARPS